MTEPRLGEVRATHVPKTCEWRIEAWNDTSWILVRKVYRRIDALVARNRTSEIIDEILAAERAKQ